MVFVGEWFPCEDGIARPMIRVQLPGADGTLIPERFLVDSGANCTVLSAAILAALQIPSNGGPSGVLLQGIGGSSSSVLIRTHLLFTGPDAAQVRIQGEFAASTDPTATDMSILGRNVLKLFDVIVSQRQNAVLLLTGNYGYQVIRS